MIQVSQVTKQYGKFVANRDISFTVNDGNIALLLGPNGAGKSTLLKCIAGLLRFKGSIHINGYANKSVAAKERLGYIPEIPAVYNLLTVSEHLEFVARAYSLSNWKFIANELLERFELTDQVYKLGCELSESMQQKLSICCALLHRPQVLIADEPLIGLDPHAIKELKNLFQEMKQEGTSILISTHMLDSVEDYWDVAYTMMNGTLAAEKHRDLDSTEEKTLEQLFFEITKRNGDIYGSSKLSLSHFNEK